MGGVTEVHGEVWEVPLHQLSRLDYYEGYPHLYTRKVIPTGLGDATIYLYNGEVEPGTYEVIRDGRW